MKKRFSSSVVLAAAAASALLLSACAKTDPGEDERVQRAEAAAARAEAAQAKAEDAANKAIIFSLHSGGGGAVNPEAPAAGDQPDAQKQGSGADAAGKDPKPDNPNT